MMRSSLLVSLTVLLSGSALFAQPGRRFNPPPQPPIVVGVPPVVIGNHPPVFMPPAVPVFDFNSWRDPDNVECWNGIKIRYAAENLFKQTTDVFQKLRQRRGWQGDKLVLDLMSDTRVFINGINARFRCGHLRRDFSSVSYSFDRLSRWWSSWRPSWNFGVDIDGDGRPDFVSGHRDGGRGGWDGRDGGRGGWDGRDSHDSGRWGGLGSTSDEMNDVFRAFAELQSEMSRTVGGRPTPGIGDDFHGGFH